MNGKREKTDVKKPWDISNWGLKKEEVQQAQDEVAQEHSSELTTGTTEHETEK